MSVDILGTSWDQCASMVQYCFTSMETIRLVRTESPGRPPRLSHSSWTLLWRLGKREIIYLSLHYHHQNDSCIKMGSDESHSNVSLIVRDKVTRQCPQTATFEDKGEPKRIRTEVPLFTSLTPYRQAKPAHNVLTCLGLSFILSLVRTPSCLRQRVHSTRIYSGK